jgi:transposase
LPLECTNVVWSDLGHEVRLMAVAMIQPYRTNQKNDQNDAEAICEAVSRPRTRFVPVKSEAQQAVLTVHRARELLVTERTALANQIRGLLLEYGVVIAQGIQRLRRELPELVTMETLPTLVRDVMAELRAPGGAGPTDYGVRPAPRTTGHAA